MDMDSQRHEEKGPLLLNYTYKKITKAMHFFHKHPSLLGNQASLEASNPLTRTDPVKTKHGCWNYQAVPGLKRQTRN